MKCRLHNQPHRTVCARCDDLICSMCAEAVDGSWFCPDCAVEERKAAARRRYQQFTAGLDREPDRPEDIHEYETAEA